MVRRGSCSLIAHSDHERSITTSLSVPGARIGGASTATRGTDSGDAGQLASPMQTNKTLPTGGQSRARNTERSQHRKDTRLTVTTGSETRIHEPAQIEETSEGQRIQTDERWAFEDALASALQSVADAAAHLTEHGMWQEWGDDATVLLGRLQDVVTALDAARALGWQTTDEQQDAEAMFSGKGTGFR